MGNIAYHSLVIIIANVFSSPAPYSCECGSKPRPDHILREFQELKRVAGVLSARLIGLVLMAGLQLHGLPDRT